MSVLRRFGIFDTVLCAVDHFADAIQMGLIYRAIPALFDWIFDASPPGGGAQVVQGHDHGGGTFGTGGISIPRNCIYSAGYGAGDQWMWQVTLTKPGVPGTGYKAADYDHPASLLPVNNDSRSAQLGYNFTAYVDVDLDTPTVPTVFADGYVAVYITEAGGDVNVRITNVSTGTVSSVTLHGQDTYIQWVPVTDIPITEDAWNQFLLEYEHGGAIEDDITVTTYGFILAEVYLAGSVCTAKATAPISMVPQTGKAA